MAIWSPAASRVRSASRAAPAATAARPGPADRSLAVAGRGGQGEGQVIEGHRGPADRGLAQDGLLGVGEQAGQGGQQDVGAAQQHGLLGRGVQRPVRGQVQAGLAGQAASRAWTWRKPATPPRSSASVNSISRGCPPIVRASSRRSPSLEVPQRGQPQEQPPQLRVRQGRHRDPGQEPVRAGQRVPAGDQQPPRPGRPGQDGEDLIEARVQERLPARGQVLLEVIEDHQQRLRGQQGGHHAQLRPVIPGPGQLPQRLPPPGCAGPAGAGPPAARR